MEVKQETNLLVTQITWNSFALLETKFLCAIYLTREEQPLDLEKQRLIGEFQNFTEDVCMQQD